MPFVPALRPSSDQIAAKHHWFFFQGEKLMVFGNEETMGIPLLTESEALALKPVRSQYLGLLNGTDCFSAELPLSTAWPADSQFVNLMTLFNRVDEDTFKAAVYAKQIVSWDREHQFCGACGNPTEEMVGERARTCRPCGLIFYPRITPAIMVAILKDERLLLARNSRFPGGFYSVLAGFVEPGEQLEECVVREVKEEVGLSVKNIRYFGSQPWPFPNSLMIAFIADWNEGEIQVDGNEIIEAGWYKANELPKCPTGTLSIAGRLIDWFRSL